MPINPQADKSTEEESDPDHQKTDSRQTLVRERLRTEPIVDGPTFKRGDYTRCTKSQPNECRKPVHEDTNLHDFEH